MWHDRAQTLRRLQRYHDALASFDIALQHYPGDPSSLYGKAACYAAQGQFEAAVANLQQAIAAHPNEYQELAKIDRDFDSIRDRNSFRTLLGEC
uniref:TPR end-of-group domain-containing protein n=1 Tax=Desertifilum tharense IPPAS B-1220 TaxID=1781255 RepID=A0ACD5GZI0_9CYAN